VGLWESENVLTCVHASELHQLFLQLLEQLICCFKITCTQLVFVNRIITLMISLRC